MCSSIQLNLQNTNNGEVYDVEFQHLYDPVEILSRNNNLIEKQSSLRWMLDGEQEEFNESSNIEQLQILIELLKEKCVALNIPMFVAIPVEHTYGGFWKIISDYNTPELRTPDSIFQNLMNNIGSK
jgi:hypothetical protein